MREDSNGSISDPSGIGNAAKSAGDNRRRP